MARRSHQFGGPGASVLATIEAREGKVKGACLEVAAIIEDWRAQVAGGFVSGLMLWETCCLPSLLHNAGTWVEMPAAAVKKLNSLQGWFLRLLLMDCALRAVYKGNFCVLCRV